MKKFLPAVVLHRGGGATSYEAGSAPARQVRCTRAAPGMWGDGLKAFFEAPPLTRGGGGGGGAHAESTSCLASAWKSGKAPDASLEYTTLAAAPSPTVTSKLDGRPVAPVIVAEGSSALIAFCRVMNFG